MANVRKTQILLESEEYDHLKEISVRRGVSVAELIRTAVREKYLPSVHSRLEAADAICRLSIPLGDWDAIEDEIAKAHEP
ncbi:MAG TPA: ribbon-helix-helix protein, CopG family [Thermoanaerobaculia bacterium]|jgi:predicted DNA-binding ribbon-helix-helix protein|nr:ribbon-helix-helix protein, CopG family [Thermoanaerobaculia bacterium]